MCVAYIPGRKHIDASSLQPQHLKQNVEKKAKKKNRAHIMKQGQRFQKEQ